MTSSKWAKEGHGFTNYPNLIVMNNRELKKPRITLNTRSGDKPMTMDMQQFFELSFWMAEELLDLEAEYRDWMTTASQAAPVTFIGRIPAPT